MIGVDRQYIPKFAVAFICFASAALAAPPVSFTVQNPTGPLFAGFVYISPYSASIDGGASVPAICDDWADNVSLPQNWTAYDTNLGTDALTNLYYSTGYTYDANNNQVGTVTKQIAYNAAAILAEQLVALPPNPWNPTDTLSQDAYSFAIWELFDNNVGDGGGPSAYLKSLGTTNTGVGGTPPPADLVATTAASYLSAAILQATTSGAPQSSYSNVQIYSAVNQGSGRPQEFIVVNMSEGPAPAIFGLYLLGLGCLAFVFRRRVVRSSN